MDVERDIVIEREEDDRSATDRASAYTTFISPASSMPRFTSEELRKSRQRIVKALEELGAESGDPPDKEDDDED